MLAERAWNESRMSPEAPFVRRRRARERPRPAEARPSKASHGSLEALYRGSRTRLWRLAIRMTGDPEIAQDLVQEAFVRAAARRVAALDGAKAEAWLTRTVVNLSHDRYRRQAVSARHDPAFERDRPAPASPESAAIARSVLGAAIDELPARTRAVLILHELEGLGVAGIAALLGIRQVTVRWHLAKARRRLATLIDAEEGSP